MHKSRIKITFKKKDQINNCVSKTLLNNFNRGKNEISRAFQQYIRCYFCATGCKSADFIRNGQKLVIEQNQETLHTRISQSSDFSFFKRSLEVVVYIQSLFPFCPNNCLRLFHTATSTPNTSLNFLYNLIESSFFFLPLSV